MAQHPLEAGGSWEIFDLSDFQCVRESSVASGDSVVSEDGNEEVLLADSSRSNVVGNAHPFALYKSSNYVESTPSASTIESATTSSHHLYAARDASESSSRPCIPESGIYTAIPPYLSSHWPELTDEYMRSVDPFHDIPPSVVDKQISCKLPPSFSENTGYREFLPATGITLRPRNQFEPIVVQSSVNDDDMELECVNSDHDNNETLYSDDEEYLPDEYGTRNSMQAFDGVDTGPRYDAFAYDAATGNSVPGEHDVVCTALLPSKSKSAAEMSTVTKGSGVSESACPVCGQQFRSKDMARSLARHIRFWIKQGPEKGGVSYGTHLALQRQRAAARATNPAKKAAAQLKYRCANRSLRVEATKRSSLRRKARDSGAFSCDQIDSFVETEMALWREKRKKKAARGAFSGKGLVCPLDVS